MSWVDRLLGRTAIYRLWMAPFAEAKFAPVRRHNDVGLVKRVLDVGCGPGTNTAWFAHAEYLGIDINPAYVEDAKRRTGRKFLVADATTYSVPPDQRFDFILLNSFLHHVETGDARRILSHLATLLTLDGRIHILDLVLPAAPSVARLLARWDRGRYARTLAEWRVLFGEYYEPAVFETYPLKGAGITLWNMVYFKGKARG